MALGTNYELQNCTLARALEVLGERWTMLVLRDCFYGVRRFTHLLEHLDISRAVLTDRLNGLVAAGVLERRTEDGQPAYVLTEAGEAVWPSLYALMRWGERFSGTGPSARAYTHVACETPVDEQGVCPRCDLVPGPADLVRHPLGEAERKGVRRTDAVSVALSEPHRLLTPLP